MSSRYLEGAFKTTAHAAHFVWWKQTLNFKMTMKHRAHGFLFNTLFRPKTEKKSQVYKSDRPITCQRLVTRLTKV